MKNIFHTLFFATTLLSCSEEPFLVDQHYAWVPIDDPNNRTVGNLLSYQNDLYASGSTHSILKLDNDHWSSVVSFEGFADEFFFFNNTPHLVGTSYNQSRGVVAKYENGEWIDVYDENNIGVNDLIILPEKVIMVGSFSKNNLSHPTFSYDGDSIFPLDGGPNSQYTIHSFKERILIGSEDGLFEYLGDSWLEIGDYSGVRYAFASEDVYVFCQFSSNIYHLFLFDGEAVSQVPALPSSFNLNTIGWFDNKVWVSGHEENEFQCFVLINNKWFSIKGNSDIIEMVENNGTLYGQRLFVNEVVKLIRL